MYIRKLKRPVDPNAPPRPNLLSHEKTIKETQTTIKTQEEKIAILERRIQEQESRLRRLGDYVDGIRNYMTHMRGDSK
jgi:predicted RNase H-like nuclease (RuvC/YqgF family)